MATYGHVYKTLIDGGLDGIMGGHIMMPTYMRQNFPNIKDEEMLPEMVRRYERQGLAHTLS